MIVRPVALTGEFIGNNDIVAIDLIDSGPGDTVLVTQEGDAVQQVLGHKNAPVHTIIIGIVDQINFH